METPLSRQERADYYRQILEKAERNELPEQVGPEMDVDEVDLYAELVEMGYLHGSVMRDPSPPYNGRAINVGLMRITPEGREHLEQLRRPQETPKETLHDVTVKKFKNKPLIVAGIIVVGAIIVLADVAESLKKLLNLFLDLVK